MSLKNTPLVAAAPAGGGRGSAAIVSLPVKPKILPKKPSGLELTTNLLTITTQDSLNTPPDSDSTFNFCHSFDQITMNDSDDNNIHTTNNTTDEFETNWSHNAIFNTNAEEIVDFADSAMTCVDPLAAEGRRPLTLNRTPAEVANHAQMSLTLNITPPYDAEMTPPADDAEMSTPDVEKIFTEGGFDLLEFVTNAEIPLEDPSFRAFIETPVAKPEPIDETTTWTIPVGDKTVNIQIPVIEEPQQQPSQPGPGKKLLETCIDFDAILKEEEEDPDYEPVERPPVKRGPGRPRVPRNISAGKRPRGRPPGSVGKKRASTATSSGSDHAYIVSSATATSGSQDEARYRRMRELNNIASKRCRAKRRTKMEVLLLEEEALTLKNKNLKIRYRQMDELVSRLKEKFLVQVANPSVVVAASPPVAVDANPPVLASTSAMDFEDIFDQI